ncbi:uncharacterized protein LOC117940408 [Etheostoma cragini]|uniref:uncharacterized protein LOC117940408 n=1 Tax=Etheostoma cragini TaxID=417921 RepID=UPI00155E09E4|nr:uncharacterized protein LOC117940408 [Etheostoma cragini]
MMNCVQVNSVVALVFLLSAGSSVADVDVNWLTKVVKAIRKEYRIAGQFCLAANIPLHQDTNTLSNVLQDDRYMDVEKKLEDVYVGQNVVIAKPAEPRHAEPQVLKNLQPLTTKTEGNVLLVYTYLSPCVGKCANPDEPKFNILKDIKVIPRNWHDYAFVFTKVCDKYKGGRGPYRNECPTEDDLRKSLTELGKTGLRLRNIFRCYKPENLEFQCYSCSSNGDVSDVCVQNNFVPGQQGGSSRDVGRSNLTEQRRRSRSRDVSRSNLTEQRRRSRSRDVSRSNLTEQRRRSRSRDVSRSNLTEQRRRSRSRDVSRSNLTEQRRRSRSRDVSRSNLTEQRRRSRSRSGRRAKKVCKTSRSSRIRGQGSSS